MTSLGEWNSSIIDDPPGVVYQRPEKLLTTPIDATYDFFNIEGEFIVQRSERKFKWLDEYVSPNDDDKEEQKNNKYLSPNNVDDDEQPNDETLDTPTVDI